VKSKEICELAGRLMRRPAVPYHEHDVREEVEGICLEHGLRCGRDDFGNLLVSLRTARTTMRPLVLAAHLDHPGFEITRQLSDTRWVAQFRGGVGDSYFRYGTPLRLLPGGVAGKLGSREGTERIFEVRSTGTPAVPPRFVVWELADFTLRKGRIYGRACDDLVGVASALATLIELKRLKAQVHVIAAISRAEEVGFHGALALGANRGLPSNSLVVSLETSRELPGVKMGEGVILRVGDRASVFDSKATRFFAEVAAEAKLGDKPLLFQRGLMAGGTCEATAYQEFGFQTAAVCVALGNYHNCGPGNRIRAEFVNVEDVRGMVELLVAAAREMSRYNELVARLPKRLDKLRREAEARLRVS
jgi:endoglucanase